MPVFVERVDKDEDADENVDAYQTRTVRPVSGQSTGSFTQLEEIDIDFRVSGLPHAVVKQTENFRVRELVKKIENCEQHTSHVHFCHSELHAHAWLKFGSALIPSHVSCVIWCVRLIALSSRTPLSSLCSPSSLLSPCPSLCPTTSS